MIIDFRVRPCIDFYKNESVFTEGFLNKYARDCGVTTPASAKQLSTDLFFDEMHHADIDKAVIGVRRFKVDVDATNYVECDNNNEMLVELLKQYPDDFYGLAGVHYAEGIDSMLEEVKKYVVDGPCKGIFFEPSIGVKPRALDDDVLFPFYEYCEKHNVPLSMTLGGRGSKLDVYKPQMVEHLCEVFPNLKVVIGHGFWPHVTEICLVAHNNSNIYICPDLYLFHSTGYKDYITAANYRLQDQFIFGSSYPLIPMDIAIEFYREHLREEIWEKVFYENTAKVLGLK